VKQDGVRDGTYDGQDRLLTYGHASYGYTHSGWLAYKAVGADTTRYGYDAQGALQSVRLPDGSEIEYSVDAVGRRVGKRLNGVVRAGWLWEGDFRPIAELDANGTVVSWFVFGDRPNSPEYMVRSGHAYRFVYDHLGSVRLVVDASTGQIAQRLDYDPWGRVILDSNPGFQPFGYVGGLYDPETKLTRLGARDYDADAGRWMSPDPSGFQGSASNLYEYAGSEPANVVDWNGRTIGYAGDYELAVAEAGTADVAVGLSSRARIIHNLLQGGLGGCMTGAQTAGDRGQSGGEQLQACITNAAWGAIGSAISMGVTSSGLIAGSGLAAEVSRECVSGLATNGLQMIVEPIRNQSISWTAGQDAIAGIAGSCIAGLAGRLWGENVNLGSAKLNFLSGSIYGAIWGNLSQVIIAAGLDDAIYFFARDKTIGNAMTGRN
jgi:RHS repeat-associated protein